MHAITITVFTLFICSAGTPNCTAQNAKQTFSIEKISERGCRIYSELYAHGFDAAAGEAGHRFNYNACSRRHLRDESAPVKQ